MNDSISEVLKNHTACSWCAFPFFPTSTSCPLCIFSLPFLSLEHAQSFAVSGEWLSVCEREGGPAASRVLRVYQEAHFGLCTRPARGSRGLGRGCQHIYYLLEKMGNLEGSGSRADPLLVSHRLCLLMRTRAGRGQLRKPRGHSYPPTVHLLPCACCHSRPHPTHCRAGLWAWLMPFSPCYTLSTLCSLGPALHPSRPAYVVSSGVTLALLPTPIFPLPTC